MSSRKTLACLACLSLSFCTRNSSEPEPEPEPAPDLRIRVLHNRIAYIPPQCFTQLADGPELRTQNPCYVCHADASEPNMASQPELQLAYDFPQVQAGLLAQNP